MISRNPFTCSIFPLQNLKLEEKKTATDEQYQMTNTNVNPRKS
jgi:hypothetical protein